MSLVLLLSPSPQVDVSWAQFNITPAPAIELSWAVFTIKSPALATGRVFFTLATGGTRSGAPGAPGMIVEEWGAAPGAPEMIVEEWGAPRNVVVTPTSTTSINVTWAEVEGALTYGLERNNQLIVEGHASTAFTDTGLAPDTLYTYRVRAER